MELGNIQKTYTLYGLERSQLIKTFILTDIKMESKDLN